jgi:hypothetical protein
MKVIDLHGMRHEDAKRNLELFINDHWGDCIKVITGHSTIMMKIVMGLVDFYDLETIRDPLGSYVIIKSH